MQVLRLPAHGVDAGTAGVVGGAGSGTGGETCDRPLDVVDRAGRAVRDLKDRVRLLRVARGLRQRADVGAKLVRDAEPRGVVRGGTIPYRPEALAKREENRKNALPGKPGRNLNADPELNCFLPGVPRATYLPHPFQIFQMRDHVAMTFEWTQVHRLIYTNGSRAPDEAPLVPRWIGAGQT